MLIAFRSRRLREPRPLGHPSLKPGVKPGFKPGASAGGLWIALAFGLAAMQPAGAAPSAKVSAVLNQVVARNARSGQFVTARVGTVLVTDDSVRTGARSAAAVTFNDGTTLRIGELSNLVVRPGNYHDIRLAQGSLFGDLKGPARVSGRFAVAAVRGTRLMLTATAHGDVLSNYPAGPGVHEVDVARAPAVLISGVVTTVNGNLLRSDSLVGSTDNWVGARLRVGSSASGPVMQERRVLAFDATTGTLTLDAPLTGLTGLALGSHRPLLAAGTREAQAVGTLPVTALFTLIQPPDAIIVTLRPGFETRVPSTPGAPPSSPRSTPSESFPQGEENPTFQDAISGQNIDNHLQDQLHEVTEYQQYETNLEMQAASPVGLLTPGVQTGIGAPAGLPPGIRPEPGGISVGVPNNGSPGGVGVTVPGSQNPGGVGVTVPGSSSAPGGVGVTVPGGTLPGGVGIALPPGARPGGVGVTIPGGTSPGGVGVTVPGGTSPGGIGVAVPPGASPGSIGINLPSSAGAGNVGVNLPSAGLGNVSVVVGRSAQDHRVTVSRAEGLRVNQPGYDALGYGRDNSSSALAHASVSGVISDFYLRLGARGGTLANEKEAVLDEAMVHYRRRGAGDVEFGRIHWFPGPVSNSTLGRLISFYTADGVLVQPQLPGPVTLQAGYFPRIDPLRGPVTSGYAARLGTLFHSVHAGVTTLLGSTAPGRAGISFDAAAPLVPKKVEVYGEVGQDLLSENLYTAGLYLPYFFDRYKTDIYVEYGHRQNFGGEFDLSAHFPLSQYLSGLATISKFAANNWEPGFGLLSHF